MRGRRRTRTGHEGDHPSRAVGVARRDRRHGRRDGALAAEPPGVARDPRRPDGHLAVASFSLGQGAFHGTDDGGRNSPRRRRCCRPRARMTAAHAASGRLFAANARRAPRSWARSSRTGPARVSFRLARTRRPGRAVLVEPCGAVVRAAWTILSTAARRARERGRLLDSSARGSGRSRRGCGEWCYPEWCYPGVSCVGCSRRRKRVLP